MAPLIKPIAIGLAIFGASTLGLWFATGVIVPALPESAVAVGLAVTVLVPLLLSGYATARYTRSAHQALRVALGTVVGFIGFAAASQFSRFTGEPTFIVAVFAGAAVLAACGALAGARQGAL